MGVPALSQGMVLLLLSFYYVLNTMRGTVRVRLVENNSSLRGLCVLKDVIAPL